MVLNAELRWQRHPEPEFSKHLRLRHHVEDCAACSWLGGWLTCSDTKRDRALVLRSIFHVPARWSLFCFAIVQVWSFVFDTCRLRTGRDLALRLSDAPNVSPRYQTNVVGRMFGFGNEWLFWSSVVLILTALSAAFRGRGGQGGAHGSVACTCL